MDAIGAGLLSAFGNFGLGLGGAMDQRRKDALDREKLEQDRSLRQQVIDQQASQFAATQRGLSTPAEQLFGYIGLPLPPGVQPDQLIPNTIADNLISNAQKQQQVAREQTVREGQARVLETGQPARLAGQLAEGEDPEAAALIPRIPGIPATPERVMAAQLLRQGGAIPPILEKILGLDADMKPMAVPESGQLYDPRTKTFMTAPGTNAGGPPPAQAGYQRTVNYDKFGRPSYSDRPIEARDDFDRAAIKMGFTRSEDVPIERQPELWETVKTFRGDIAARTGEGAATGAFTAKQNQPIGANATKFIHPQTGQSPDPKMLTSEVIAGGYREIQHPADRTALADLQSTKATVYQLSQMADKLITATSPVEAATQGATLHAGALTKSNALAATYYDTKQAFLGTLSRSLGGERGVLTNQDISRVNGALASFFDTVDIKNAKNAILQNLLDTASEAKMASITGQPAGEGYKQRIQDLISQMEQGAAPTQQRGGARPTPSPDFRINPDAKMAPKLPPGGLWRDGQVISESGKYLWDGSQWRPR